MRISELRISNYRSIKNMCLDCSPHITLLGPNNHGKSNVLSALEFGLSTSDKPAEEDFFAHRETENDELWVEMTFSELTEQEKITFKRYILPDNTICIRKTARLNNGSVEISYNGWILQPEEDWLRNNNVTNYTKRDEINATPLNGYVPSSGRISKKQVEDAQAAYIREHIDELTFHKMREISPLLGQKNVGGGVLPEFYLIPAVRDLTDEIKIKTTTAFGRLMNRAVREMAERDLRFNQARTELERVISLLNQRKPDDKAPNEVAILEKNIEKELRDWNVSVNIEVAQPEIEKLFELGTEIHLDDGVRTTADRKGHGLQRAVIFALLRSWAGALRAEKKQKSEAELLPRKQSASVIFAMEEPELFLHPHSQRRLSASLREIADTPEHQVFICTHSTYFVDLSHYKEVAIIRKDNSVLGSQVRQCTEELFAGDHVEERKKRFHMGKWINPDRGEIFFAQRVIFVEGETERVIFPYLAEKLNCLNPDISIIDCGSKHNLPLYVTIAKAFHIPYIVIHDEDPLNHPIPDDWPPEKIREKKRTFRLNQDISQLVAPPLGHVEQFSPDFERASGVSRTQGKKKGKALAALEHFEGVSISDLPEVLVRIIQAAFASPSADQRDK